MKSFVVAVFIFHVNLQGFQSCPEASATVHIQNYDGPIYLQTPGISTYDRSNCDHQLYHINQDSQNTKECGCVSKQQSHCVPINSVCQNTAYYSSQNYKGQNYNGQNYNAENYNGQNYNAQNYNSQYPILMNIPYCTNNKQCCNIGTDSAGVLPKNCKKCSLSAVLDGEIVMTCIPQTNNCNNGYKYAYY